MPKYVGGQTFTHFFAILSANNNQGDDEHLDTQV
jgi:hypothetical protein